LDVRRPEESDKLSVVEEAEEREVGHDAHHLTSAAVIGCFL
jgi:hypothetical protein